MAIRCECGKPVHASGVNLAAAIATCDACGAVFSIAQSSPTPPAAALPLAPPSVVPDAFSMPEHAGAVAATGYRDSAEGGGRRWSYRWFRWMYVFAAIFLVFWDTISFGIVFGGMRHGGAGVFSLLLPHAWIGAAMTYWTVAHLFNRSTIELGPAGIVVKTGPVPWRSFSRGRAEIAGFDVHRGMGNRGQPSFEVRVIGPDRRAKRVLAGLSQEEATYLASELNDALHRLAAS